ncbi:Cthe_2314 family HEPN domain-containing protein [Parachryseolinea silvisoli]|uniref:Cthe_2314 family HEPN domain-containing protein n=1 Tax=Parachryseolinea silvisoli TaxID=2873601 RepID=UPI002265E0BC|nr:Cthe_2314 family HEPN domain-containing protein [Parachryseolinea silvisoli]MCD9015193.1 hypothetical protein [Parachryseolinea silvisoli]
MDTQHPLYHFREFNEQIFATYKEFALQSLIDNKFDGQDTAVFLSDILRRKRPLHAIPYSYFKIHDEFNFISNDLKYVTGILYILRPFIVNTQASGGTYHQTLEDRRYLEYANFGLQIIYNFWDRIGDLLHLYFDTSFPITNVIFGKILSQIKDPYNSDPSHILNDPIYKQLKDLYDTDLKAILKERNNAVHHFQLEAQHYWGNLEYRNDPRNVDLNTTKQRYPDFFKKHLELFFQGFELALKLIDQLPDRVLVFSSKVLEANGKYRVESARVFEGANLITAFDMNATYSEEDIIDVVADHVKPVSKRLIIVYDEPQ